MLLIRIIRNKAAETERVVIKVLFLFLQILRQAILNIILNFSYSFVVLDSSFLEIIKSSLKPHKAFKV